MFSGSKFVFVGDFGQELKQLRNAVTSHGGSLAYVISKETHYVVSTPTEVSKMSSKIQASIKKGISIVNTQFVTDSVEKGEKQNAQDYLLTAAAADDLSSSGLTEDSSYGSTEDKSSSEMRSRNAREIRIFVSSTFRDMQLEREQLVKHVFPELRQLCSERNVFFSFVDLRWGVTGEAACEGSTINICLSELDNCIPYFICMLGERYGWSQTKDKQDPILVKAFNRAQEKFAWVNQYQDRSITELEIRHAVLNRLSQLPEPDRRCFFYFRDANASFIKEQPEAQQADFASEGGDSQSKLAKLKQEIRGSRVPVRNYKNLTQFSHQVRDDLRRVIMVDAPEKSALDSTDTIAAENEPHEYFAAQRAIGYVANESTFSRIQTYTFSQVDSATGLVLTGESGMGKSSLLANFYLRETERLRLEHPEFFAMTEEERRRDIRMDYPPLIILHFIGATPQSAKAINIVRRVMALMRQHFGLLMSIPDRDDDVIREFPNWVQTVCEKGTVILLIDGLNQLAGEVSTIELSSRGAPSDVSTNKEDVRLSDSAVPASGIRSDSTANALNWIPMNFHPRFRFVASTTPGSLLEHLMGVRQWDVFIIPTLTIDERRQQVRTYLEGHSKKLSPTQLGNIANSNYSPLYLRAMMDELRSIASFENLDALIQSYGGCNDVPSLFDHILSRWEKDYKSDDTPSLVSETLSLILCSNKGLSESELIDILGIVDRASWSKFFVILRENTSNHGGLLTFYHQHFAEAVNRRYIGQDKSKKLAVHKRLAEYFSSTEDKVPLIRKVDEYPYSLEQSKGYDQLLDFLSDLKHFSLMYTDTRKMNLFHYWHLVGVKNQRIGEIYFSALNSFTSSNPAGDVLGEVLRQTARCMEEIGEYEKANKIFHQSLYADTTMFGQWHEVVATDMYFLALTYIHLANYTSARNFARQAKDMRSNVLGPQHLDTADCINLLALICKKGADFATARELYKQALAIAQNTLGSLHGKLAEYLTNLGDVHRKLDEFVDAEKCYRRAHEITNVLYGPDSVQAADVMNSTALVLKKKGEYEQAEPFYQSALAIIRRVYGNDHPKYSVVAYNLADVYRKRDMFAEAEALYYESLEIVLATYGANHPEVAEIYNDLGLLKKKEGRYQEAIGFYQRAMDIIEKTFGLEHPKVGLYLTNTADVYRKLGEFDQADAEYRRALAILEAVYGPNHIEVAEILNAMGMVYKKRAMYDEAEPLYERALRIVEKSLGYTHPKVGVFLNNIADLHRKRKNFQAAYPLYRKALTIIQNALGKHHSECADVLNNMGLVQHAIGNYRDAVSLFKKAIKIVVKEFGPVHFKAGMFSANMADSLAKCQETEQANDIFSTAIHTLRTTLGPDHIELGDAIAKYAEFKHEQGALKESFAMYKAAMAIVEKSLGKSHPKWKQYQKIAEDMEPFVASSSL